jgi:hypothetical protein
MSMDTTTAARQGGKVLFEEKMASIPEGIMKYYDFLLTKRQYLYVDEHGKVKSIWK